MQEWIDVLDLAMEEGCSDLPPSKVFKPKFNLAKLTDYKGVAPASYWGKVPFKQGFPGDN